ncbi:MAG: hypothetical protein QNJ73_15420 [Gammaproteobacteria bacterium]|nr:hypothetical protein [Gammaproteobacteria bacterium]
MNIRQTIVQLAGPATVIAIGVILASCATTPPPCNGPTTTNLNAAIDQVQTSLANGCEAEFDRYFDDLLTIAEGDPKPENKRAFSEFLVWSNDQGLLSRRQAERYYNRYFNVKFMALEGDFNNCSHTCPRRDKVYRDMERELNAKERGLLKVSLDNDGYYRANELYQEVELVLEATCTACAAK